jgi:hypothetical protein
MPAFKTNLDIQQNQLLNAVLHRCSDLPANPVEGQLYYNEGKHLAYLWDGQYWVPWGSLPGGGGGSGEVRQFITTILNPNLRSGAIMIRLYEDLVAVRIDAHFSTVNTVYFNIDYRTNVNQSGTNITDHPMTASYDGNEYTTIDHAWLKKDDWLYLSTATGAGDTGTVVEGDPTGATGGVEAGTEPPAGDGEVLGVLTVVLTCVTY